MHFSKVLFFFVSVFTLCHTYKILGIFTIPWKSHYFLARKLFTELANRGHEVTFLTPYLQKDPVKNLQEVSLESLQDFLKGTVASLMHRQKQTRLGYSIFLNHDHHNLTALALAHENFQRVLKSHQHYDAVIVYYLHNEAFFPVAQYFKAPLILFKSLPPFVTDSFVLSHPISSSYVPNILSEYSGRMDFWQRLKNTFYDLTMVMYYQWVILPKHRQLVRDYIPGSPDLYHFLNNDSLVLINSHVSTNEISPMVPNVVEIGGYFIEDPEPLPMDLKEFLDSSTNGVILFSIGSNVQSASFPKEKLNALIKTFSKLKENVLWKLEKDFPGLPKNVKTMEWIPQTAVLAHPNVKLFLTHGGLLSVMESVYYGVPMVGIPIFSNQHATIASAMDHGYAVKVFFSELTEDSLSQAVNEVLRNPKYKDNAERYSRITRDRPVSPLDSAMYWIEYVIRHNGGSHLKYPGGYLRWYQRSLLDVAVFVIFTTMVSVVIFVVILRRLFKKLSKAKKD